jgi:putative chitinase
MIEITPASINALISARNSGLPPAQHFRATPLAIAAQYAEALEAQRDPAQLDTAQRVVQFMAQIAHESGGFRGLVESLAYRDPVRLAQLFSNVHGIDHARRLIDEGPQAIGCCIYANKLGNGGLESGDGWRFRGRGFLMNTGRTHYAEVKARTGLDVIADPDLLGQADGAARAASTFWIRSRLNAAADSGDTDQVTLIVNGSSMQGRADRVAWAVAGRSVWT